MPNTSLYRERDYEFANTFMNLRTTIGLTQQGLAKHLGISSRAVENWEQGLTAPKAVHLKAFLTLCVQTSVFATGREEEQIRAIWKAAHQKVLLDEYWLQELLARPSPLLEIAGKPSPDSNGSTALAIPLGAPRNPYKGLQAFRIEDAQDFFGQDRLIEELLEKVQQLLTVDQHEQTASRLLTVLGTSGSGKSSVVMAGFIPKLQQGALAKSEHWIYLNPMAPGKHPLEALTLTLSPLFPERSLKSIREDLEDDSARGLHLLLTTSVEQSGANVLLVIDQFEELFTQTATEDERRLFLEILLTAISEPHGPLLIVLTLRADFYDRPLRYPNLGRLIKNQQVITFPMEIPDLRNVIEQPAKLPDVQLTFEESLVDDLLFDVQGQVGALPLLQFTLDQLFQHREGHLLTRDAYRQIGGVKGALTQHAESIYQSLPTPASQRLARALFLRLINPGTVEEDITRRRIALSELVVVDREETARLAEVTQTFIRARLLTTATTGGVSTIEVSHEALIQAWVRLRDWLHEARDDIRFLQKLSKDAASWSRLGQPTDWLYHGSQLALALKWREANLPSLEEDCFLQACIEERLRSRRRTFVFGLIGVAGTAGISFLATTLFGSKSPPPVSPLPFDLPYIYKGHSSDVTSVAWELSGKYIASASFDKTVQVWDASNGSLLFTCKDHTSLVTSVAWEPSGKRIASASADKTVRVWDASNGSHLLTYKGHSDIVNSVAWSQDGKRIASASDDHTVQVWDASNGSLQLTYKGHPGGVGSVAWEPSGKRIASTSDDPTVQVWDASNGNLLLTYKGHSGAVNRVAWEPSGKRIASASVDKTVQVWDASNGSHLLTYKGHSGAVDSVAWEPSGKQIASASRDDTVQVWDASNGSLLFTYQGHSDIVWSVAWSPDGKRIASASKDDTVQIWDTSSRTNAILTYKGHSNSVSSVAWEPSGKHIASADFDEVQVWDVSNGSVLLTYQGHSGIVTGVAWEPSGKHIASASFDKTVQVWDASNGSHQLTYKGHSDIVWSVAWEPSGKRIASASRDNTVRVWDASNGSVLFTYKGHSGKDYYSGAVNSVAWSPDGTCIASASVDKTVRVWDASNGRLLLTYKGHSNSVSSVAWEPSGKRIASASYDRTVQVWDVASGSHLLTCKGHTSFVWGVAWSPDGKRIASASFDQTVRVWNASNGRLLLTYKGHSGGVSSVAWSPDGNSIASASEDVQIWDTVS